MEERRRPALMALDPSLTATGIVVVEFGGGADPSVVHAECVRTEKDSKSRHVYQADQDGARVDKISDALIECFARYLIIAVACEAPAGAQHANAAKALALAYGTCRAIVRSKGLSPLMVQAHEARIAACGSKAASKAMVEAAMLARWGRPTKSDGRAQVVREAIADALAVAVVGMSSPLVLSFLKHGEAA